MKKSKIILLFGLLCIVAQLNAQFTGSGQDITQAPPPAITIEKLSVGLGGGLDYGGFGANILFYPVKNIGAFAGGGYALAGFGFNAGIKARLIPKKPETIVHPYIQAMYGYNAAIAVMDATEFNKMFYGPTFGAGVDLRSRRGKKNYWSMAILVPIRSKEVKEYMDDLEQNHGVEFAMGLLPVGFSIGYRFGWL